MAQIQIPYPIVGPVMDKSKPSNLLQPGRIGDLRGVDGRYGGSLRKLYGMLSVKQLQDAGANLQNVSYFKHVAFQKGTTAYELRGFVVAHGSSTSDLKLELFYYDTETAAWATTHTIYDTGAGNAISSSTKIDCDVNGKFLYVVVEGKAPQVLYWTSSLQQVDMGPGADYDEAGDSGLEAPTSHADGVTSGGNLNGSGTYRFAYRWYDSTRDVYSALSDDLTVTLDEGDEDDSYYYSIKLGVSLSGTGFDTLQLFRTVNLGDYGAFDATIFYLERTLSSYTANDAITMGHLRDDALVVQDSYDPEEALMTSVPQGGAIGVWEGLTFISGTITTRNGVDTHWSDPTTLSGEYFTTETKYLAHMEDGRPRRYIVAGDTLFILHPQSIIIVEKKNGKINFTRQHLGRGLTSAGAAHAIGNDLILCTPLGLAVVDGKTATMQIFTSLDRLLLGDGDWAADKDDLESCYSADLNCSMFLNPTDEEIVCVWWSSKTVSLIEGANFVGCSQGIAVEGGDDSEAYFITTAGLIVKPDVSETGYGNMWGIDGTTYTLNGTATSGSGTTIMYDTSATYHSSLVGAKLYFTSGDNAGVGRTISAVDVNNYKITVSSAFPHDISAGDRYAIAPVPFKARLWNIPSLPFQQGGPVSRMMRRIMVSMELKVQNTSGFTGNDNDRFRLSAYRGGSSVLSEEEVYLAIDENPPDEVERLNIDGIDIEPYIEQISCGSKFELTNVEVGVTITGSRNISD